MMFTGQPALQAFLVPARHYAVYRDRPSGLPEAVDLEWIERVSGDRLDPASIALLFHALETSRNGEWQASDRLRRSAGLVLYFATEGDRQCFSQWWDRQLAPVCV